MTLFIHSTRGLCARILGSTPRSTERTPRLDRSLHPQHDWRTPRIEASFLYTGLRPPRA